MKGIRQYLQAPTASNDAVFSGSATDLHLQNFSLSQTEVAGRPGWCSSRGEPRAECPPRGGVRSANEPFAPAQPPPRAIALPSTETQSTTSRCPHR
eukprot:6199373-Pleurochrysis_carterae.AAC.2